MRRAFHEEGESFHAWLTSLVSDEPMEQGAAIDPAKMQVEMPDIPVAGSGDADENDAAAGQPLVDGPAEPEGQGYGDQ